MDVIIALAYHHKFILFLVQPLSLTNEEFYFYGLSLAADEKRVNPTRTTPLVRTYNTVNFSTLSLL
jgi:hypothetical protein